MTWPGAYEWHEGHTGHHRSNVAIPMAKADQPESKPPAQGQPHPHMDAPPAPQHKNDQAAGVGVSTYAKYAQPYGIIAPGQKSNLFFYPLHGKLQDVKNLVGAHGYQTYYAGGSFGKPDLANKNYNTKHLMVYDPSPQSGGDFGEQDYTDAWRNIHELSHASVYPELNSIYGEGRRIGKLGVHRTAHEAKRAVHWEWLAAHRQRQLSEQIGVKIPDDVFHKELNTVMHDAIHRAITGRFTEPSSEGFVPHSHKVPLEQAFSMIDEAARNLGLQSPHQLLKKSEDNRMIDPTTAEKLRQGILAHLKESASELKKTVSELEAHYGELRQRELRKSEGLCKNCGKEHGLAKCGDMAAGKDVAKAEKKLTKENTTPSYQAKPDRPHPDSVLPADSKAKDVSPKDTGAGGQIKKIRKAAMDMSAKAEVKKADVPMAKPPSGKSPSAGPSMSKPAAPAAPAAMGKDELALAKAGPRLGGKDPLSQSMTQHAASAAMPAPAGPPKIPGRAPKLTAEDHARRAAEMAAFTPAGAFGEHKGQGAVGGAMTPEAPAPSGLDLAPKAPKPVAPAAPGIKIPGRR